MTKRLHRQTLTFELDQKNNKNRWIWPKKIFIFWSYSHVHVCHLKAFISPGWSFPAHLWFPHFLFILFLSYVFHAKNVKKTIFGPALKVRNTQTLMKIYNRGGEGLELLQSLKRVFLSFGKLLKNRLLCLVHMIWSCTSLFKFHDCYVTRPMILKL